MEEDVISCIERKLLELKTASKVGSNIIANYYSFSATKHQLWEITYANGSQPIITNYYGDTLITFEAPSGNTQRFAIPTLNDIFPKVLTLVSTRPILSVVKI